MKAMQAVAVIVLLCVVATCVEAGCYGKNKHLKKVIADEDKFFNHVEPPQLSKKELPKNFNWCKLDGKNLCAPSWNQHIPKYCGSCWLHGTLSMIQDRIKIGKGGKGEDVMLGRQTLLNCAPFLGLSVGCDGGDPIDVLKYMTQVGLPDEGCYPYEASDYTKYPGAIECPKDGYCRNCMPINGTDTCWAVETPIKYSLKSYGKVTPGTELGMMNEIYHRGPITCSMATPAEFSYGYRGGIYDGKNDTDIDHDVEIVGWGHEEGTDYWVIRNSWGTYWGELGFFRLKRGTNLFVIEGDDCWYGVPDWSMEDDVLDGKYGGSMYGLVKSKDSEVPGAPVA